MITKRKILLFLKIAESVIMIIAILFMGISSFMAKKTDKVVIGSKNFTEQLILGNMYADLVQAKTDLHCGVQILFRFPFRMLLQKLSALRQCLRDENTRS